MPLSITALAANYKQIADAILNAGPLVQDNLADLKVIVDRLQAIRDRTVKHFGLSGDDSTLTDGELSQLADCPDVQAANEAIAKAAGVSANKGPFMDTLMQILQLAMSNPALLQLILSLLKKPAA